MGFSNLIKILLHMLFEENGTYRPYPRLIILSSFVSVALVFVYNHGNMMVI
jgi:hypothetical protein